MDTSVTNRRPRGPGATYGVLTLIVVVLLAVFAFAARQPPPPTIAEFAPQAVENITESPNDQSSSVGRGAGAGDGGAEVASAALTTPPPINVPRVRKCVGDPPRQIEDPQSPPCVPYWEGDNGGATYKGVTRDEIRVAADNQDLVLVAFFNKRFEFYGRKISIVGEAGNTSGGNSDEAVNRAAAASTDEQLQAFAGLPQDSNDGSYHDEMARRNLISVEYRSFYTEDWLAERSPHIWEYMMAADRLEESMAAWACTRLVGRPARYGADGAVQSSPRVFGMIFQPTEGNPLDTKPFERGFARCGAELKASVEFNSTESVANGILQLKTAGVTSAFCLCNVTATGFYHKSATAQGYYPEWLFSSYQFMDESWHMQTLDGDRGQLEHSFGTSVQPKETKLTDTPPWWATKEVDPESSDTGQGVDSGNGLFANNRITVYRTLLLLASGIQMAGPKLTPMTFQQGLHRTRFPNPDTVLKAGSVGFLDGDHSMTDDMVEWWWSNSDKGPYTDSAGAYCYLDGGARRTMANWPAGDEPFFKRPCNGA